MFTGLVEEVGTVVSRSGDDTAIRLVVAAHTVIDGTALGDSIAVDGACLTVVHLDADAFGVDIVAETIRRTAIGSRAVGDPVNLERALRVGDRLGGHMVQGHVDGVGTVAATRPEGDGLRIAVHVPAELRRYIVQKGSITVDGVSLTVAAATSDGFEVALIPHTLEHTTLGRLGPDHRVNLEVDLVAKYVEALHAPYQQPKGPA
jgi:riboflavin synthase